MRETELIVKKKKYTIRTHNRSNLEIGSYFQKIEAELSDFLNQKIKLKISKNGKGKIEIPFDSENKLNEIIKILQS